MLLFNESLTTVIYTYFHALSRHDALPISPAGRDTLADPRQRTAGGRRAHLWRRLARRRPVAVAATAPSGPACARPRRRACHIGRTRSELRPGRRDDATCQRCRHRHRRPADRVLRHLPPPAPAALSRPAAFGGRGRAEGR